MPTIPTIPTIPTVTQKPLFLLSNDDGIHAPGLAVLAEAVTEFGDVVVVAPHMERSAASHGITISNPLRCEKLRDNWYAVDGTPADCVLFAIHELLDRKPDFVVSGINRGANLGTDTLYSGTVAAAMEAVLQGVASSYAVSCHGNSGTDLRYDTAARVLQELLKKHDEIGTGKGGMLNINVPSIPVDQLQGIRAASLGRRNYAQRFVKGVDPRGNDYFWLGGEADGFEDIPGSDCAVIAQGYATVTFLKPSLVDEMGQERLSGDLGKIFP